MKNLFLALLLIGTVAGTANANPVITPAVQQALLETISRNVIDWKVGDRMEYKISGENYGDLGTSVSYVARDTGEAIWVNTDSNLAGQSDKTETLIRKSDGAVLEFIHNGKPEQMTDQQLEVTGQDYEKVTVPAGTFKAMKVTARSKDVKKIEVWIEEEEKTVMTRFVKQRAETSFLNLVIELVKYQAGK